MLRVTKPSNTTQFLAAEQQLYIAELVLLIGL